MGSIKKMPPIIVQNGARIFWSIKIRTCLKFPYWSLINVQKKIVNIYLKLRSFNS